MNDYLLYEAIDEKLRDAIGHAEADYDNPFIVIVAHPEIADALKKNMNPELGADMQNIKVNGWRVLESEDIVLAVVVCGEDVDSEKDRIQQKIRDKIL